jgi:hypothetical protein
MSYIDINMNHQIRNIYRSIDELTGQMDYLQDLINLRDYNPLNYTENIYDHTSYNMGNPYSMNPFDPLRDPLRDPLFLPRTTPFFPMPPTYNSPLRRQTTRSTNRSSRANERTRLNQESNNPININATTNTPNSSNWTSVPYSNRTQETSTRQEPQEPQLFEVVFNRTFTFPGSEEEEPKVTHKMVNENTELEVFDSSETTEDIQCSICRANFENGDIIRKINSCNHTFHQACIDKWFEEKDTCPVCRTKLQPEENNTENEPSNNRETETNNSTEPTPRVRTRQIPVSQSSETLRELLRNLRQRYNLPDPNLPSL